MAENERTEKASKDEAEKDEDGDINIEEGAPMGVANDEDESMAGVEESSMEHMLEGAGSCTRSSQA